jgi:N utilization substance protein A
VLEVEVDPEEHRASVVVPDRMLSLAIGKEGQNARLAAKLTGWRIDIRSQAASEREGAGVTEAPSTFEPFAPGEVPDIDIIEEAEEVAAAAEAAPPAEEAAPAAEPATALQPAATTATDQEAEEDVRFAEAFAQMAIPVGEEREAEDYGEEDEEEEYEVPTAVVPESRPTAIRFAEDVLPKRVEETEEAKKAAPKKRRAARYEEEEEFEDIDYSGRSTDEVPHDGSRPGDPGTCHNGRVSAAARRRVSGPHPDSPHP